MNITSNTTLLQEGHPVRNYFQENDIIHVLLGLLTSINSMNDLQKYINVFNQLYTIEKRFIRKENQLFPFLEKKGWDGPSQGMWFFHDNLRDQFRLMRYYIRTKNLEKININTTFLVSGIYRLMQVEETVLFPKALQLLNEEDWITMRKGEEEIGWMLPEPPAAYPNPE